MNPLPSVVIVGRPNVGKSTLFNALTGMRRSIVGDEPGITRDRIYGEATHHGRKFTVVDTGGIITNDEEMIPTQILKQAHVALKDAALIIFLIDGRTEITGADRNLAAMLRKLGKPVLLAVNKIDSERRGELAHEFHALGFEHVFPVSAEHRLGLDELLSFITRDMEKSAPEPEDDDKPKVTKIKVAIIGRPNVGKSTLLNALTGTERSIVSPIAGTTRDAVDETIHRNGIDYVFVDTAGIRRKGKTKQMAEKLSVVMARRHLRMSHVAIMIIDATEGVLALDATIAGYAHEEGRAVILCVNKWDTVQTPMKRKFMEQVNERLKFLEYASTIFVSAKTGEGVKDLFPRVRKAYESASRRVGTGELNRFVETLRWEYEPKLKYITQASVRPPTFIAFTDSKGQLHFSAERFLVNRLREHFNFEGTPVVVKPQRAAIVAVANRPMKKNVRAKAKHAKKK